MTAPTARKLTIQPAETGGILPYPYHVDQDGNVGRQDFWKGAPLRLIGFVDRAGAGEIDLTLEAFLDDPDEAVDAYPVFEHADGDWHTYGDARIAQVRDTV
jgi:hypothetical protein